MMRPHWIVDGILLVGASLFAACLTLNSFGAPAWVRALAAYGAERYGWHLSVGNLRLRGFSVIEAVGVELSPIEDPVRCQVHLEEVKVRLNWSRLFKRTGGLEKLSIRDGRIRCNALSPPDSPDIFQFNRLDGELGIDDDGTLILRALTGDCDRIQFSVMGSVKHIHAFRDWASLLSPLRKPATVQESWRKFFTLLRDTTFSSTSRVNVAFHGDLAEPTEMDIAVRCWLPQVISPHGSLAASLEINLNAGERVAAVAQARIQRLRSEAVAAEEATIRGRVVADSLNEGDSRDASVTAWLNLEAGELQLLETDVSEVDFHLEVHVPRQRPLDNAVTWDFTAARLRNSMGQFEGLSCFGLARMEPQLQLIRDFQRLLVFDRLEDTLPLRSMTVAVGIEAINLPCIKATEFVLEGQLDGKGLWITKLQCRLYGGSFNAESNLDLRTRRFGSKVSFNFDGHRIAGMLTPRARRWLSQFGWEKPPEVTAEISLRVPRWHGAAPRWAVDVRPGIQLEGEFRAGAGSFRGVPVSSAHSRFILQRDVWNLPNLVAYRPEGKIEMDITSDMGSHDFYFLLNGDLDLHKLRPLLANETMRDVLDRFEFSAPPDVAGRAWGNWHESPKNGFDLEVRGSDFAYRGERCDTFSGRLFFNDRSLLFSHAEIGREDRRLTLIRGGYDFREGILSIGHAHSTMDPSTVARVIGDEAVRTLAAFTFPVPPTVTISGYVAPFDLRRTDLRFELEGGSLVWNQLRSELVPNATVHWKGYDLGLGIEQAEFYGGLLSFTGDFQFDRIRDSRFSFDTRLKEVSIHLLSQQFSSQSERVEGKFNAHLVLSQGQWSQWETWQGYGSVRLSDGVFVRNHLFTPLTPFLKAVTLTQAESQPIDGLATFSISDGVLTTSDLRIKAPPFDIRYRGRLTLNGEFGDARLSLHLPQEPIAFGSFARPAFFPISRMSEHRIVGSLKDMKIEPVLFLPRLFKALFL